MFSVARDSYHRNSELLKVEDVRTQVSAIVLRICAKFVLLNAKQEKQAFFLLFLAQIDKFLNVLHVFYGFLGPFLGAKF